MAKAYNAQCLVLKHTKLGETDTIITFLASDGSQIRVVAKGLRKPGNRIGARLQLFAEVDVLLHEGKSLDIVREVKSVQTNAGIQEDLERVAVANVVAEFLEKLGRDGALLGERLYQMSTLAFTLLGEVESSKAPLILAAFLFKAMSMQGFAPAVRECALCGNPIEGFHAFDVSYGGAICEDSCIQMGIQPVESTWQKVWVESLMYSTFAELLEIDDYPSEKLIDLSHTWVREHAGFTLKSITFLKSL